QFLDPWSANLVRLTFGAISICMLALIRRAGKSATARGEIPGVAAGIVESTGGTPTLVPRREVPLALLLLTFCAVFGPVGGGWMSVGAIDRAQGAVAATLMAMTPVFILPFAVWLEHERISWRAAIGALVAVAGVGILTGFGGVVIHWIRSSAS